MRPFLALVLLPLVLPLAAPAQDAAPKSVPESVSAAPDDIGDLDWQRPPAPDVAALQRDLDALKARTQDGAAPADAGNAPLLRFKIEQVEQCLDVLSGRYKGRTLYNTFFIESIAPLCLQRAQEVADARGDAAELSRSTLQERAYIAANDGSAQPFWVFVPQDYSPARKYGLAVFLHGYGPDLSKINPWLPDQAAIDAAHKAGLLLVLPHGRRNTDFVDVGEDDVLRVTQEVQKHYPIDAARIFLTGPSMGGFGTWAIGMHRPSTWAGLAPMSARTDFYLWFKLSRGKLPAWKRLALDSDDPVTLAANAAGLPMFFQHGALDPVVSVEQSRRMDRELAAQKIPHLYREVPQGDHYIYFGNGAYEAAFGWMGKQNKALALSTLTGFQMGGPPQLGGPLINRLIEPHTPNRVRYTSGNARNEGTQWVRITDRLDYSLPASIEAWAAAQLGPGIGTSGTIGTSGPIVAASAYVLRVTAKNVAAFTLSPPLPKAAAVSLEVNGKPMKSTRAADGSVSWRDPAAPLKADWPQTKSPQRSGPIKNAWRDPFLIVYGTQVLEDGRPSPDESRARAWAAQWQDYADGAPRIKPDAQVTEQDKRDFNLILFGDARSNSLIREADPKLPLHWTPAGVRLGSGAGAKLLPHLSPNAPLDAPLPAQPAILPAAAATGTEAVSGTAPGTAPGTVAGTAAATAGGRDVEQDAALVDVGANAVWWNFPPTPEVSRRDLGLVFCYASPWSAERVIVVQSGPLWGAYLPFNHKWDLLPDWAVYSQNRDASDNTNQTIAAGFFGRSWDLVP